MGERAALVYRPSGDDLILRLGYILNGTEDVILPDSLLDDWGHEISSLELYSWIRENGMHFPRAEIFGFDVVGRPRQCFVREVDLTSGYACFVYQAEHDPLHSGVRLNAILVPDDGNGRGQRLRRPTGVPWPLAGADVQWWSIGETDEDIQRLDFLQ